MKIEELIEPTDIAAMSELDEFIKSSLVDLFYESVEIDVITSDLFEDDSVFLSKVNDMNTDFAYLCEILPDGTVHCIDHTISIFNINSVQTHFINIGTKEQPKEITLAFDITADESEKFEKILNKRKCVFAWTNDDMSGIDRTIAEHRIPTDPTKRPIKQKLRRLRPEWAMLIKEEVEK